MKQMKETAAMLAGAIVLAGVVLGPATEAQGKKNSTVKVVNRSTWTIEEMYLSPIDEKEWGPDQLGDAVIKPDKSFTLDNIPCDSWDVKLVDEDGDECVVADVDLCKDDETWEITSKDLLKCQAASE